MNYLTASQGQLLYNYYTTIMYFMMTMMTMNTMMMMMMMKCHQMYDDVIYCIIAQLPRNRSKNKRNAIN